MKSNTRIECENAVTKFSNKLVNTSGNCWYIGVAGDPKGGEYAPLFKQYNIKTLDADPKWNPDIVADITAPEFIRLYPGPDLIICVQVLEHVEHLWKIPFAFYYTLNSGGHLIVDCPWMYPYHAEPPSFGDFWRLSKDGIVSLFSPYFEVVDTHFTDHNNSVLFKRRI